MRGLAASVDALALFLRCQHTNSRSLLLIVLLLFFLVVASLGHGQRRPHLILRALGSFVVDNLRIFFGCVSGVHVTFVIDRFRLIRNQNVVETCFQIQLSDWFACVQVVYSSMTIQSTHTQNGLCWVCCDRTNGSSVALVATVRKTFAKIDHGHIALCIANDDRVSTVDWWSDNTVQWTLTDLQREDRTSLNVGIVKSHLMIMCTCDDFAVIGGIKHEIFNPNWNSHVELIVRYIASIPDPGLCFEIDVLNQVLMSTVGKVCS
mmetsp:Transcript_28434/g.71415  ORF Transcript_28434/g.71415 Transcript_28434/m.71415 type:complete len:263 (-) Transcript_28434:480-1268(-)